MSQLLQLNGEVVDERDHEIERLQSRIEQLEGELEISRLEAQNARKQASRAVAGLRQQLTPMHNALRQLFGEMDHIAPDTAGASTNGQAASSSPVWEAWKQRLGGSCAKVIDALMTHRTLNTQQLAIATGLHRTTIPALIHKLKNAGLINKSGNDFSLKQI